MKNVIRQKVLNMRGSMPREEVLEKSAKIHQKLFETQHYQSAATIMTYVDFQNEVETRSIIARAFQEGKNVAVPICGSNYTLLPIKIESFEDLEPGTMGILEPKKTKNIIDVKKLDLVLVPGIAFDRKGNRLGYGLAYYDRFLNSLSPATITIALAYSFQIFPTIPQEEHDHRVNIIITENELIKCS